MVRGWMNMHEDLDLSPNEDKLFPNGDVRQSLHLISLCFSI